MFSSFADRTECDGFGDDARSCVFGLRPSLIPAVSSRWGQHALGEAKQRVSLTTDPLCVFARCTWSSRHSGQNVVQKKS